MTRHSLRSFEDPGLEGPDYVALVIEWDEPAQVAAPMDTFEDAPTQKTQRTLQDHALSPFTKALAGIGALGFALWGLRRLRAA